MKSRSILILLLLSFHASAQTSAVKLWKELEQKRSNLGNVHQEYEVGTEYKISGSVQAWKRTMILDLSKDLWRQADRGGAGDFIDVFDGKDKYEFEDGGDEFIRHKWKEGPPPAPTPYDFDAVDWPKAKELERRPCGYASNDNPCVVLQLPFKRTAVMDSTTHTPNITEGGAAVVIDTETGLLLRSHVEQSVQKKYSRYIVKQDYSLKRFTVSPKMDPSLFALPSSYSQETKEFSRWNAARIKERLAGKTAPELSVSDMKGNPLSLSSLKGKTILLDFWTSWCPPCQADAPDLEKLQQKYGGKELAIIGISLDEERAVVEKFLKGHPKSYPVALTTENQIPRPYQVRVIPTYIIIDENGKVTAAVEGEKGFGELKKLLQKAGMDVQTP